MPIHRCRITTRLLASSILLAAVLFTFPTGTALALDNGECDGCHGDNGILKWSPDDRASNVAPGGPKKLPPIAGNFPGMSLHVDPGAYKASVHGDLSCTDCHGDIKDLPHKASLARVDCSGCHSKAAAVYAKSSHVLSVQREAGSRIRRAASTATGRTPSRRVRRHFPRPHPERRRHVQPVPRRRERRREKAHQRDGRGDHVRAKRPQPGHRRKGTRTSPPAASTATARTT